MDPLTHAVSVAAAVTWGAAVSGWVVELALDRTTNAPRGSLRHFGAPPPPGIKCRRASRSLAVSALAPLSTLRRLGLKTAEMSDSAELWVRQRTARRARRARRRGERPAELGQLATPAQCVGITQPPSVASSSRWRSRTSLTCGAKRVGGSLVAELEGARPCERARLGVLPVTLLTHHTSALSLAMDGREDSEEGGRGLSMPLHPRGSRNYVALFRAAPDARGVAEAHVTAVLVRALWQRLQTHPHCRVAWL